MNLNYLIRLSCWGIVGAAYFSLTTVVQAQVLKQKESTLTGKISIVDIPLQKNKATDLIAHGITEVTGVQLNQTDKGLKVILETAAGGERLVPLILPEGNSLAIDILDATLGFGLRNGFTEIDPAPGINKVSLTKVDETNIRLTIIGKSQAPSAEIVPGRNDLVLSVTPQSTTVESEPDEAMQRGLGGLPHERLHQEEIEVIATGEAAEEDNYKVDNANVGTRTDTPVKDVPQSIQTVPQEVIKDRNITSVTEALQNSSGVSTGADSPRDLFNVFTIRGFDASANTLTNGLLDPTNGNVNIFNNIDRVEILKGPASVLFGQGAVGGTVNYVTKQPLNEPFYSLEFSAGNYNLYSGAVDLSGPLNEEKTVAYRLNGFIKTSESFVDFFDRQEYQIAPVLTWDISDKPDGMASQRTKVTFEGDYSQVNTPFDFGLPVEGTIEPNPNGEIPRDRTVAEPDIDDSQNRVYRIGYNLEHNFSDSWQLRSQFRTSLLRLDREIAFPLGFADDLRTVNRLFDEQDFNDNIYNLDNYVVGEFATGSIEHKLVSRIQFISSRYRSFPDIEDN